MKLVVLWKGVLQVQKCQRQYVSGRTNAEEVPRFGGPLSHDRIQRVDVKRVGIQNLVLFVSHGSIRPSIGDRIEWRRKERYSE
jgi:hypothetical protein